MTTVVQPVVRPGREVAGTRRLAAAVARDLQMLYGRNGGLDEAGAERHLRFIVAQARKDAAKSEGLPLSRGAELKVRTGLVARARRQIVDDCYETEERVEAALCGLADELGV